MQIHMNTILYGTCMRIKYQRLPIKNVTLSSTLISKLTLLKFENVQFSISMIVIPTLNFNTRVLLY